MFLGASMETEKKNSHSASRCSGESLAIFFAVFHTCLHSIEIEGSRARTSTTRAVVVWPSTQCTPNGLVYTSDMGKMYPRTFDGVRKHERHQ